jgi:hypothetical protein
MKNAIRLVQIKNTTNKTRKVALVKESMLILLNQFSTVYDLANQAIGSGVPLTRYVDRHKSSLELEYDRVYKGNSEWKLLPPFDHPFYPDKCILSGTGLTHKASADNRQKMHVSLRSEELTDSMKMYMWGLEGGHPDRGEVGVQPEWFFKGNGCLLKGHGDLLEIPPYGEDGGEEAEIAGAYLNDEKGRTWRIGFVTANEFSDHIMEKKNYLYLAPSKIRNCAIGPELIIDSEFKNIEGQVRIIRDAEIIWKRKVLSGQDNMSHSLRNLEYHHFKYANHRLPGQVHIHFFGADAFSFGEGIILKDGDNVEIQWEGMGRPLRNTIKKVIVSEGNYLSPSEPSLDISSM